MTSSILEPEKQTQTAGEGQQNRFSIITEAHACIYSVYIEKMMTVKKSAT